MATAAAPDGAADDGWNAAWDEEPAEARPASWEAFFAQSTQRTERAMRDAGVDPRKCAASAAARAAARGVPVRQTPRGRGGAATRARALTRRAAVPRAAQGGRRAGEPQRRAAGGRHARGRPAHLLGLRRGGGAALGVRAVPGNLPRARHNRRQRLCACAASCGGRTPWRTRRRFLASYLTLRGVPVTPPQGGSAPSSAARRASWRTGACTRACGRAGSLGCRRTRMCLVASRHARACCTRGEHAKRHAPSTFGPCRQDSRVHTFPGES
jgi:hypothetical protein